MTATELREFKGRHRLNQAQVAKILGPKVDRHLISNFENGTAILSAEQAEKLRQWERKREPVEA